MQISPLITLFISLLTFLLGLIAGHRLALSRDTRKEYNQALEPIALWLHKASVPNLPYPAPPSTYEIEKFTSSLSNSKSQNFSKQLAIYKAGLLRSELVDPVTGYRKYRPDGALEASVNEMQALATPK